VVFDVPKNNNGVLLPLYLCVITYYSMPRCHRTTAQRTEVSAFLRGRQTRRIAGAATDERVWV